MDPVPYPPAITPGFMGIKAPPETGHKYPNKSMEYFQNYRNEHLSRMPSLPYEWGAMERRYVAQADIGLLNKVNDLDRFAKIPPSQFTMLDLGRQMEVDNFYRACQMHRDQYKDIVGRLHPLDYFKTSEYRFQCSPDPTSKYLKSPTFYVKYKSPQVLPITLERTYRSPMLPERALTGVYNPSSDISFKR